MKQLLDILAGEALEYTLQVAMDPLTSHRQAEAEDLGGKEEWRLVLISGR